MNQSDQKLCRDVAEMWMENGGDHWGFLYCWKKIADEIKEMESALEGQENG